MAIHRWKIQRTQELLSSRIGTLQKRGSRMKLQSKVEGLEVPWSHGCKSALEGQRAEGYRPMSKGNSTKGCTHSKITVLFIKGHTCCFPSLFHPGYIAVGRGGSSSLTSLIQMPVLSGNIQNCDALICQACLTPDMSQLRVMPSVCEVLGPMPNTKNKKKGERMEGRKEGRQKGKKEEEGKKRGQ